MDRLDAHLLIEIAKHDLSIWKVFSVLNKNLSTIFNPLSYELKFRVIQIYDTAITYELDGLLNRSDGPAVITHAGEEYWYKRGKLHRTEGPAMYDKTGNIRWFVNGMCHREDGPAVIFMNGYQEWRQKGTLHRIGGPAKIYLNGDQEWYQDGKRHREDGPAIIKKYRGYIHEEWWLNGKQYRLFGCAVINHIFGNKICIDFSRSNILFIMANTLIVCLVLIKLTE